MTATFLLAFGVGLILGDVLSAVAERCWQRAVAEDGAR